MAAFRGTILGERGETSRLGNTSTGLRTRASSWQGAVEVRLSERIIDGKPVAWALVELCLHGGAGTERVLYDGPVAGEPGASVPFIPAG